jgi:hypothetical protein
MDSVQFTSRLTAATADARPLVAAHRRHQDEDERRTVGRGSGPPGGLRRAVVDALGSEGLALPGATATAATTGEVPAVERVQLRQDLHEFMHSLHEAVKGARREARRSAGEGHHEEGTERLERAPRRPFADGLGALASDVAAGKLPEGLQSAFDKLLGDLGPSGEKSPSLLGFINKLQALLGYAAPANDTPAVAGNLVDVRA